MCALLLVSDALSDAGESERTRERTREREREREGRGKGREYKGRKHLVLSVQGRRRVNPDHKGEREGERVCKKVSRKSSPERERERERESERGKKKAQTPLSPVSSLFFPSFLLSHFSQRPTPKPLALPNENVKHKRMCRRSRTI
jgi:hypothetical protein